MSMLFEWRLCAKKRLACASIYRLAQLPHCNEGFASAAVILHAMGNDRCRIFQYIFSGTSEKQAIIDLLCCVNGEVQMAHWRQPVLLPASAKGPRESFSARTVG